MSLAKLWNSLDVLERLRVHCFPQRSRVLHIVDDSRAPAPELYNESGTAALQPWAQYVFVYDRWGIYGEGPG
jgi:hypothetical protein